MQVDSSSLRLAFSILDQPPYDPVLVIPLVLLVIAAFAVRFPRRGGPLPAGCSVAMSWAGLILIVVVLLATSVGYYGAYLTLRAAALNRNYQQVEGCLQAFHPMPASGHDEERIKVGGRVFAYSDFTLTPAFRNAESRGGPIHRDSYVRIGFVGSDILRVEVADKACPPQMQDLPRTDD